MGGLGGHVDHLYDNPDLTFTDMIKIMTAASNGEITGGEKLDCAIADIDLNKRGISVYVAD